LVGIHEIRNHDDSGAAAEQWVEIVQREWQVGSAADRLDAEDPVHDRQGMAPAAPGRCEPLDAIGIQHRPDPVTMPRPGQR
jgi:hypothetical protein